MSAEQNILQTIQLTNNLIASVHEFAKIIEQWLKENNDNKYLQEIFNHMQNKGEDSICPISCKSIPVKKLALELEKEGIPYIQVRDDATGIPAIIVRDTDAQLTQEKVEMIHMQAHTISEVNLNTLVKNNIHPLTKELQPLAQFSNVSSEQLFLIKQKAAQKHIVFAKQQDDKNNFTLFCSETDRNKFSELFLEAKMQLHGELGVSTRANINNDCRTMQYIMDKCHEEKEKDIYIISAQNPNDIISISKSEYEHSLIRLDRDPVIFSHEYGTKSQFQKSLYKDIVNMRNPILVSKDEYLKMKSLTKEERKHFIYQKKSEQNKELAITPISKAEKVLAEKERLAFQLMNNKLLLENASVSSIETNFYDTDISFSEYIKQNLQNIETSEEYVEEKQNLLDIAAELDTLSPEQKGSIKAYLSENQDIMENYFTYEYHEQYIPSLNDLNRNDSLDINIIKTQTMETSFEKEEEEISL